MNRRDFLTGAAALGAAHLVIPAAPPAAAASQTGEVAPRRPRTHAPRAQSERWRLEYPRTRGEIRSGTVTKNLTFPPGDPRRY